MKKKVIFSNMKPILFDDDDKTTKWIEDFSETIRKMPYGVTLRISVSFQKGDKNKKSLKKTMNDYVHYTLERPDIDIEIEEVFYKN